MSDLHEMSVLLSVGDVAQRCAVSEPTVRRWIAAGRLPALRVGGAWRVAPEDLGAWLEEATRARLSRYQEPERAVPYR